MLCLDPSEKSKMLFLQVKCNDRHREQNGASGLPNDNRDVIDANDNIKVQKHMTRFQYSEKYHSGRVLKNLTLHGM